MRHAHVGFLVVNFFASIIRYSLLVSTSFVFVLVMGLSACGRNDVFREKQEVIKSAFTRECRPHEKVGRIYFDCNLSDSNYEILRNDLQSLQKMELKGQAASELQTMLNIPSPSGEALFHWFEDMVQFILDESFKPRKDDLLALNIGNSTLRVYKIPFAAIDVPGHGLVEINFQRVGVVQLGPKFFNGYSGSDVENVRRLTRLAILMHERRHSEGLGSSMGFPHVSCPSGHTFEGEIACDPCSNGAYTVESLFLQAVTEGCDHCSRLEKALLSFTWKDLRDSVLSTANKCDPSLELP